MINFIEAIGKISNGEEYFYQSSHFKVRIIYKNKNTIIRFQVKECELSYVQSYFISVSNEEELRELVGYTINKFMVEFKKFIVKEIL